jgi:peroxiredoxin
MLPRPSRGAALAVAGLALFTVWISWRAKTLEWAIHSVRETIALLHRPAPDFSLKAFDGRTVSLADFRGKQNVVVSFWASWCGPCRLEAPALRTFYQKTHKDTSDFEIVAVSIDDDPQAAEDYATKLKLPYPVVMDAAQKTAGAYGVDGIPQLLVIDKNGTVTWGAVGYRMGVEFELARALGIKDYSVTPFQPGVSAGAPDGSPSH